MIENKQNQLSKCRICKKEFESKMKGTNKPYKTCEKCREKNKNRPKNKCIHDRLKNNCSICNGCEHGKRKNQCSICGKGKVICVHGIQKYFCKLCKGSQVCPHGLVSKNKCKQCSPCIHGRIKSNCRSCGNAFDMLVKKWMSAYRKIDKMNNRYSESQFMTEEILYNLLNTIKECVYCKVAFIYDSYCANMVTIERKHNKIGHDKDNVILCCRTCNFKHKNDGYFEDSKNFNESIKNK
jgi:hypothetical protein